MGNETVLAISGLTKKYGSIKAIDDISFCVSSGNIIGLLGPNGAGKTTTINMVLGILEPTQGLIEIFGKNLREHRSTISKDINFVAVYAHMPANLTVRQNLYIFGLLYKVRNLKERITSLLHEFDLEGFADTKAGLLSSGESSRLNLAKALMNHPRLLLLDEPTASLDPSMSQLIRQRIKEYAEETKAAILWTSHNMQEIEDVCDHVLFLSHGRILLSGNPKILPSEHGKRDLEELFITVAREPLSFEQ
ncbi:MAG: ABC transporter ATP-binding protein [Deltaproteobacteria bacterium RBG_13_52_11b]|nr:MAG: ABC transporter ATP-binding protein [Deltaproteobacteria bacterium RBG_13_52_11b]